MEERTITYYNESKRTSSKATYALSFNEIQDRFVELLPKDGTMLDFGCGSGRDTIYFANKGLRVTPVDGSRILCDIATRNTGIKAKRMMFQELQDVDKYNGVWAGCSVMHLPYEDLVDVLTKVHRSLKKNGILYISFKYGLFEGVRNGRHFTDMDESKFGKLLAKVNGFEIDEMSVTPDIRPDRHKQQWMNVFLRRCD